MQIYVDLRCLQDENYAFRGVGFHSAVLLRNSRRYWGAECELVGLIDANMGEIPFAYKGLVDRTQTVFAADRPSEPAAFVQLSPMTHDPLKVARLVGQPNVLSCAIVYDFIPLDVCKQYLPNATTLRTYASQLGWLAAYNRFFPISEYSSRRLREILAVNQSDVDVTGVALRPAFEAALRQREPAPPIVGTPPSFVLFVGGADPRKNIDVLLISHANLRDTNPDLHLVVIGKYPPAYADAIRHDYCKHGGDPRRLHIQQDVSDSHLIRLYQSAVCTVCSSQIEGFSLPVIEAAACGCPMLVSDNEAHRELIRTEEAIFPPNDSSALTARLRSMVDEPVLRMQLQSAQRNVPVRFSAEAVCGRSWLPIVREMRQRSALHARIVQRKSPAARQRLAILSPFPPDQSGVADYTRRTIQALGRFVDVDLYTDASAPLATPEIQNFLPISDWPYVSGNYDSTLTVIGNSHFHTKIIDIQKEHGGPCLVHDNRLAELYSWWKGPEYFRNLACRSLGRDVSMAESQDWIANPGKLPSVFFDELISTARPLIVHSKGIQAQCRKQYEIEAEYIPFCCYRTFESADLTPTARRSARTALGVPMNELVVVSLGIVSPAKAPQAFILAIAQLHQAGLLAHLYFVGSPGNMQESLKSLARGLRIEDWVHFTSDWVSEVEYHQFVLAADFAIQLRNHFFGGLSGAMLDCIASGLVTVANDDLAEALESPSFVLRIGDDLQHEQIAAQLIEAHRLGLHHDRLKPARQQYLREHSFERYALDLLKVVGLTVPWQSDQLVA